MTTTRPFRWRVLLPGLGALALLAAGVHLTGAAARHLRGERALPGGRPLASFTQSDVAVQITLEDAARPGQPRASGRPRLVARFTPTRPGFHLYAAELPRRGINGVGRPTLLEIARAPALAVTGPLTADRPAQQLRSRGGTYPVYPAGPVALSLPVRVDSRHGATAELSLTYMACSERTCLPPVEGRRVTVRVPGGT